MRLHRLVFLVVSLGAAACGSSEHRADRQQPSATSSPSTEAPSPTPPPAMPAPPEPALMQRFAREDGALRSHVDESRGLLRVEIFSDASGEDRRAGPDGIVRIAERLCGSTIDPYLVQLKRDLALRVEQSSHDPLFACTTDMCSFPAEMEFDRRGVFRFASDPGRGLVLDSIVRIEGGTVSEEWAREAEVWANEQLRRLGPTRCR